MRETERQEEEWLAEYERVRTEGHAPAPPPAPGYSRAEFEGQLTLVRSLLEEGEFDAASNALGAVIDRLQSWPPSGAAVPVTVEDFAPATERQRHQRMALRGALVRCGLKVPDAGVLDELIVTVEAGF